MKQNADMEQQNEMQIKMQMIVNDINTKGWLYALNNHNIPEQFFRDNLSIIPDDFVSWNTIFQTQILSEEFIAFNKSKLDLDEHGINWIVISTHQVLSEDFMHQFRNKLDWDMLSIKQTMSEEFIEKHEKYVDWYLISGWQELSNAFIDKWSHKLDMEQLICYYRNMSSRLN